MASFLFLYMLCTSVLRYTYISSAVCMYVCMFVCLHECVPASLQQSNFHPLQFILNIFPVHKQLQVGNIMFCNLGVYAILKLSRRSYIGSP